MKKRIFFGLFVLLISVPIRAQLRLSPILSDNMVLQQHEKVAIWGNSIPRDIVRVTFKGQVKSTIADSLGNWCVYLDELVASKKPAKMIIRGASEQVVLSNILVGEVWLASGQSNMGYPMKLPSHYKKPQRGKDLQTLEYAKARNETVRLAWVKRELDKDELPCDGWQEVDSLSLGRFSAVAYFFAKELSLSLGVPVGIIQTTWGGSRIESWTPSSAYEESPTYASKLDGRTLDGEVVGVRYEKMVKGLCPYTIKGFLWYQGESNLIDCEIQDYAEKQRILIDSWRRAWNNPNLPFYYVQLAPYAYSTRRNDAQIHTWESLPRFWEVQTRLLCVPHCGMVVVTDLVDDPLDIHPPYKWEVGHRLALWALAKNYGKDVVYRSPQFKSVDFEGRKAIVSFSYVGTGLISSDGESLRCFQLAGADGRFRNAKARILGIDKVEVVSDDVENPVKVRFAWDELAMPNLKNSAGLPANSFRTDSDE